VTPEVSLKPPEIVHSGAMLPDDMLDTELPESGPIREPLRIIRDRLEQVYLDADAAAMVQFRRHRRITRWATVFGAAAVVLSVLSLVAQVWPARHDAKHGAGQDHWISLAEGLFVLIAIWAVIRGVRAKFHPLWLLERHKAERCRLIKYQALTDERPWLGDSAALAAWSRELQTEAERLRLLSLHDLEEWAAADHVPTMPAYDSMPDGANPAVHELAAYYKLRRLSKQMSHFARRIEKDEAADRATRVWPARMFYLSIVCALLHLSIHLIHELTHGTSEAWRYVEMVNAVLLLLAVVLPVIGAAIRTWRGAWEFARNTVRFRAKYFGLEHYLRGFTKEAPAAYLMRQMWYCEQILQSEHREWLRLMMEAEWFG